MGSQDVLFQELVGSGGDLGIIILNRSSVLNALNQQMIVAISHQLDTWEQAEHIKAVIIRAAEGRAFCAGGDLRLMYDQIKIHASSVIQFFYDEYHLNRKIFHYSKPYIALLDGITMGGGAGVSLYGSHRIATKRLVFAMPETGIGFFPDVGGSYFLPRLTHYIGYYLGLTGVKITSDDCLQIGIADYKVPVEAQFDLIEQLRQKKFSQDAHASVSEVIRLFQIPPEASLVMEKKILIHDCFSLSSIEEIIEKLKNSQDYFCQEAALAIAKKSPTSLKVALKAMQMGAYYDFDECMQQEYRLVTRFLQGHDFIEGIRAVIIDKDQTPQWQPSLLSEVTAKQVDDYFVSLVNELI